MLRSLFSLDSFSSDSRFSGDTSSFGSFSFPFFEPAPTPAASAPTRRPRQRFVDNVRPTQIRVTKTDPSSSDVYVSKFTDKQREKPSVTIASYPQTRTSGKSPKQHSNMVWEDREEEYIRTQARGILIAAATAIAKKLRVFTPTIDYH